MKTQKENQLFTTVECARCAICCTEPIVPVTDSDVKRICKVLNVPAQRFVRFYSIKEMEYDPDSDLWIKFPQGKRAMGLKKALSRCLFLDNHKNCSIYNDRPMTCRTFPYVIDLDEEDNPKEVKLNKIVSCSCKRRPKSSLSEVVENVREELNEDDSYYDKIEIWNNRKPLGTTRDFLIFISSGEA